jgi:MFS family permease
MAESARWRLSVMMFLEFFIWGAWYPLVFGYLPSLGFTALQQGLILNTFALGSFAAMFFSTQFADRNFAAEKFLAFSNLVGGVAILAVFWVHAFWPFFFLMLVHSLFYVPTLSIANGIAFANLKDAQKDFGRVRLWGTIGWIAASWPFIFILADWDRIPALSSVGFVSWLGSVLGTAKTGIALQDGTRYTFLTAGLASLVLAGLSLMLPHTPPKPAAAGREKFAWLEAMRLLRIPYVLVLFIVTFFDSAVHQGYFIFTGRFLEGRVGIPGNWVMPVMSVGQIAEIGTMAILGIFLKRLGWRKTMVIGILGHAFRFLVFALFPDQPWIIVGSILLHGICYAFFFATVYIFVDEFFPKDARSSAQGLFNFLILGLGPFVANFILPWIAARYFTQADGQLVFSKLFLVPSAVAFAAAAFLFLMFRPPATAESHVEPRAAAASH